MKKKLDQQFEEILRCAATLLKTNHEHFGLLLHDTVFSVFEGIPEAIGLLQKKIEKLEKENKELRRLIKER